MFRSRVVSSRAPRPLAQAMAELQAQWDAFLEGPDFAGPADGWAREPFPADVPDDMAEALNRALIGEPWAAGPPTVDDREVEQGHEDEEEEEEDEIQPPAGGFRPRGKGMGIVGKGKWDNLPTVQPV